jgi:GNAT superfamily N-acetyltransferase
MAVTERSVEIRDLIVAHDLRRKRIGRFMIDELDRLAGKMEREWLVADRKCGRGFLERVGFHDDGEWMVRRVKR